MKKKPLLYEQRIAKLKRRARAWGGQLVQIERDEYPKNMSKAPFTSKRLGVSYKDKIVFYSSNCLIPEIIHEMAHVFASKHTPAKSDEWSFFGWEWTLAKTIGLTQKEFASGNYEYLVYAAGFNEDEFGALHSVGRMKPLKLRAVLLEAVETSKKNGLIAYGRATAIR